MYADLQAEAAFLRLSNNGIYLLQLQAAFAKLQYLVNKLAWYYALNGINILLLIGRVLKRMDFQPRLGVVTRSLALAGPDLIHFCLVCGMVFVGYAMMAHLIFGNTIQVSCDTYIWCAGLCFVLLFYCGHSTSWMQLSQMQEGTVELGLPPLNESFCHHTSLFTLDCARSV